MAAQISSTKCNVCTKGLGKLLCYECQHFLCDSCNSFHEKFPATKRHCVTDSRNIDRTTSLQLLLVCEEHKLDFVHYCQTCESLTCSTCVTTNHKGHSFNEVSEITAKSRALVNEKLAIIQTKIQNLSDLIQRTKVKDISFIKEERDQYIGSVNQVSDFFTGIINSMTDINITRASDYYVTEKQGLDYSVEKLEKMNNEYKIICNKLEQLLLQKHDVAFCSNHRLMAKELVELEDIPNIEKPLPIGAFDTDGYIDLVIEKIQNKYPIRSLKVKDSKIRHLEQCLEQKMVNITELQQTKDAELAKCRQQMELLETDVKQKTKSLKEKYNEIQHLKQNLEQEYVRLAALQQKKDAELVKCRMEMQRLETDIKQRAESLKEKDNEIDCLQHNLLKGTVRIDELQQKKDEEGAMYREQMHRLETEYFQKQKEIQHLKQRLKQEKGNIEEIQQKKAADVVNYGQEIQRLKIEVKENTELRILLFGKAGDGKSAVANTLLGKNAIESTVSSASDIKGTQIAIGTNCQRLVKVVEMHGVLKPSLAHVEKAIGAIFPGPHAILIVFSPNRSTAEKRWIEEMQNLFIERSFLMFTILVMVRTNEIRDENGDLIDIHNFINNYAFSVLKSIYEQCGRRIVAIENRGTKEDKQKYAQKIFDAIENLGGGYFNTA